MAPTEQLQGLRGQRVVVTRARHQAGELAQALEEAGATVAYLPLIEVVEPEDPEPLERAVAEISRYSWVVFTSSNAVEAFLGRDPHPPAPRHPHPQPLSPRERGANPVFLPLSLGERGSGGEGVFFAVIGPATAKALREHGVEPDLVADRSVAEGLAEELLPRLEDGARVLVPQAADARPALVAGLRQAGIEVEAVVAYRKIVPADLDAGAARLFDEHEIGWVTFTSPRIVRQFAALMGDAWPRRRAEVRALSIGPTTSAELAHEGVEHVVEAASPTPAAMVAALVAAVLERKTGSGG